MRIRAATSCERPSGVTTLRTGGGVSPASTSVITISIWNGVAASASGTFWRTWLTSSGIEIVPSWLCSWIASRIFSR